MRAKLVQLILKDRKTEKETIQALFGFKDKSKLPTFLEALICSKESNIQVFRNLSDVKYKKLCEDVADLFHKGTKVQSENEGKLRKLCREDKIREALDQCLFDGSEDMEMD